MKAFLFLMAVIGAQPEQQSHPRLLIAGTKPKVVRFTVSFGDQPAEQVWSKFLDHWQVMFDANGDGKWNASEAADVPALTNPSGKLIRFDSKSADTNGDEQASRDEIIAYYRVCEMSAIHTPPVQNDITAIQVSATLWTLLDTDRDGKLSPSELATVPQLLNRWDLNEDECLAFGELSSAIVGDVLPPTVSWLRDSNSPDEGADILSVPIRLDSLKSPQPVDSSRDVASSLEWIDRHRLRLDRADAKVTLLFAVSSAQRIVAAQQYLLGEINLARGNRLALDATAIKADPTLEWLAPFVAVADQDGDAQLSEAELNSVTTLLAEGAAAQVSMVALCRGRNLFDHFDRNSDNQLDLRELIAATRLKSQSNNETDRESATLDSSDIPLSINVKLQRGPLSGRFGRLRIARRQAEAVTNASSPAEIPRWFKAMDRNRDQSISPEEFLGTPDQFKRLDRNEDGVISEGDLR